MKITMTLCDVCKTELSESTGFVLYGRENLPSSERVAVDVCSVECVRMVLDNLVDYAGTRFQI